MKYSALHPVSCIMHQLNEKLVTVSVPECPLCGRTGEIRFTDLKDGVCFSPGKWNYRVCDKCEILWLDPRPTSECYGLIYPQDYLTHAEPANLLGVGNSFLSSLKLSVKLETLNRAFGYSIKQTDAAARFIGAAAARIPLVKHWAGLTVRFVPAGKGRLLDVGCGNGEFLLMMSKLGWDARGIEPDDISASIARRAGLKVYNGSVESAELEPESFDAITMNHVIEHLADPVETVKKLSVALKPGGLFVSVSPNPSSVLARLFGGDWRGLEPPRHFVLFGVRSLKILAERAGLCSEVSTTSRGAEWMARESVGLQRKGDVRSYTGRRLPKAISWFAKVSAMFRREAGEEAVLAAVKEK